MTNTTSTIQKQQQWEHPLSDALQDYRATTMVVCLLNAHNDCYQVTQQRLTLAKPLHESGKGPFRRLLPK